MKILVTGARGFIGKNLIAELRSQGYTDVLEYDKDSGLSLLDDYCSQTQFVFHLAGINRPNDDSEFMAGNYGFTSILLEFMIRHENACPILVSSSIQAELDNLYGRSKKAGEDLILAHGRKSGAKTLVYRLPNVFGKWCKPNYNSAVATFCHNIAHDRPIKVSDPSVVMSLVYIDDVVEEFINALKGQENRRGDFCEVARFHTITLGDIVDLVHVFKKSRAERSIPNMADVFTKQLYSTYLSHLPRDQFSYGLKMNVDHRGSFTEFIRTPERGQVSVNVSRPGITKGNHWHHTKNEKFLVVSGKAAIRFRRVDCDEVLEYLVSGDKLEVVDIPPGYTHNIENLGDTDLVTVMWANESFDPTRPDTYYLEV